MILVDVTVVFDAVNRNLLWDILCKFGCLSTFIAILQQFHTCMCAQIVMVGYLFSCIPVDVGVKQGCVLAQIIFNLFMDAIALLYHRDLHPSDSVGVEYRPDDVLFNY